jgi:hypothetical protein
MISHLLLSRCVRLPTFSVSGEDSTYFLNAAFPLALPQQVTSNNNATVDRKTLKSPFQATDRADDAQTNGIALSRGWL